MVIHRMAVPIQEANVSAHRELYMRREWAYPGLPLFYDALPVLPEAERRRVNEVLIAKLRLLAIW